MLQVLVDELNRYGGDFEDAVEILNVKPIGHGSKNKWTAAVTTPGDKSRKWEIERGSEISISPLHMISSDNYDNSVSISVKETIEKRKKKGKSRDEPEDDDDFSDTLYLDLRTENLTRIDPFTGTYVFDVEDYNTKFRVVFTEVVKGRPNYQIGASDF
jgi:hypothetical protein